MITSNIDLSLPVHPPPRPPAASLPTAGGPPFLSGGASQVTAAPRLCYVSGRCDLVARPRRTRARERNGRTRIAMVAQCPASSIAVRSRL